MAFFAGLVAYFAPIAGKDIGPIMPILRSNFWLTLHVLTITASYGAGLLALGLGNMALGYYLFGRYRAGWSRETGLEPIGHGWWDWGEFRVQGSGFRR